MDVVAAVTELSPQIKAAKGHINGHYALPNSQIQAMAQANLFKSYVHKSIGGLEIDAIAAFRAVQGGRIGGLVLVRGKRRPSRVARLPFVAHRYVKHPKA